MQYRLLPGMAVTAGALAVGLFVAQGWVFIENNSGTYDEAIDITAGYAALMRQDFRLGEEHPPVVKELMALAVYLRFRLPFEPNPEHWANEKYEWIVGQEFVYKSPVPAADIPA